MAVILPRLRLHNFHRPSFPTAARGGSLPAVRVYCVLLHCYTLSGMGEWLWGGGWWHLP
jgi:hypothetical protein